MTAPKVVAIVDDDPSARKGIERLLHVHGFGTELFTSGEEFLSNASASKAECLILDVHLTGMSGIELCRWLAAFGSEIPVIIVTASDDDAIRKQAVDAGCVAYLRKPFSANLLLDAIGKLAS